jgi:hypothetical protein
MTSIETLILNKNGLKITKCTTNNYKLRFHLENNNVYIEKIIDFSLIKLVYDLNPDVYEETKIEHISDSQAKVTLLLKHFFEDLGMPQRYSYVHMTKHVERNNITFITKSITTEKPSNMPSDSELMPIQDLVASFDIITPHVCDVTFDIFFDKRFKLPVFAEKIIAQILFKVFTRVKQFIENITI